MMLTNNISQIEHKYFLKMMM